MSKKITGRLIAFVLILTIYMGGAVLAVTGIPRNRHDLPGGVQNIVKRTYRMPNISWTPWGVDITAWAAA